MPSSSVLLAKRALVSLLGRLAVAYNVTISVSRDSSDDKVTAAYRKVVLKVHPDKGGAVQDAQDLQAAKGNWETARRGAEKNAKRGRPAAAHNKGGRRAPRGRGDTLRASLAEPEDNERKQYRVQSRFTLLTYHGFTDVDQWERFVVFVEANTKSWTCRHWCATLEETKKEKLHAHLALQFKGSVDRSSRFFLFEGLSPRVDCEDPLGEGLNRRREQLSINRMMFYCFADKLGTARNSKGEECVAGNYFPAWCTTKACTYPVLGRWPETLWKARKLSHSTYDNYLHLCRDSVLTKRRNLQAVQQREEEEEEEKEMQLLVKRLRSGFSFTAVPEAEAWLEVFKAEKDRYPFLLLLGPSRSGKTEYAKSLFKSPLELKVGKLEQVPDGIRAFSRKEHDGLVLDDIRAFSFLVQQQEKLQSKYDAKVEFGTTPGGQCAFTKWLWRVPVVVTANYTTTGQELLETDDFLANPENRTLVHFKRQY